MIHIEYIGHKPIISEHGIGFETKEDKFEFIEPAAHILTMLLDLNSGTLTKRIIPKKTLKEADIFAVIARADAQYEAQMLEQIAAYTKKIDAEIDAMDGKTYLTDQERKTFKDNLVFMRQYRIQRATNKVVYEWMVNHSVALIKAKQVADIKVPFSMGFVHAAQSLETTLMREKNAPKMSLNVKMDDVTPYVELTITYV